MAETSETKKREISEKTGFSFKLTSASCKAKFLKQKAEEDEKDYLISMEGNELQRYPHACVYWGV